MHNNNILTYWLIPSLACASLCLCSRPSAQSARSQHHLGTPTAGGALQVSDNRMYLPVGIVICLPRRVPPSWMSLFAGKRKSDELKYSSLADCGGIASVFFFFCFFLFIFVPPLMPPPSTSHIFLLPFQSEASPLHLLADWPRRHRKHPLSAEEEVSFIACACACVFPDLRALQNPIKRSSICWACAEPFSGQQRTPGCRSPILNMCSLFYYFYFFKPLNTRDSCVFTPG